MFLVFFFFSIRSVPKRDGVWIRAAWNWVGVFTLVVILGVYTGGLVGLGWVGLNWGCITTPFPELPAIYRCSACAMAPIVVFVPKGDIKKGSKTKPKKKKKKGIP